MTPIVQLTDVTVEVPDRTIIDNLSMSLDRSHSLSVVGPSGSGKTTLLNCIAGLAPTTSGTVMVDGVSMNGRPNKVAAHRLRTIGLVFQFGELLPELTAVENAALPAAFAGFPDAAERAHALLMRVGLATRLDSFPDTLSGGEVQRVGIARALCTAPAVVLADEPTGALDPRAAEVVTQLLIETAREQGAALILATHDPAVAVCADRSLRLHDGRLVSA